jgi:hypothetical protein
MTPINRGARQQGALSLFSGCQGLGLLGYVE